jgi:hypothetical protein
MSRLLPNLCLSAQRQRYNEALSRTQYELWLRVCFVLRLMGLHGVLAQHLRQDDFLLQLRKLDVSKKEHGAQTCWPMQFLLPWLNGIY